MSNLVTQASLLALVGPASFSVFAEGFLCLWLLDRKRHYLLLLAAATGLYCIAALCQILFWPTDPGTNALVSAVLYAGSALGLVEGVMRRSKQSFGLAFHASVMIGIVSAIYYFFYVTPSLAGRINVHNLSYGLLFLYTAVRLGVLRRGKPIDRILYWVLVAFGLHFFPRTISIAGHLLPDTLPDFATSTFWISFQISLAVFGGVLAMTLLAAAVIDRIDDLKQDRDTDGLTGLLNRRGFEEHAQAMLANARSSPATMIVADIDHFKLINDNFGHRAGDRVLQHVSTIFTGSLRGGDFSGRIGGEEFAVMVQNCGIDGGAALAERMRTRLAREPVADIATGPVTISLGVVEIEAGETLWHAIDRADQMLYAAKNAGRNRVAIWDNGVARFAGKLSMVV